MQCLCALAQVVAVAPGTAQVVPVGGEDESWSQHSRSTLLRQAAPAQVPLYRWGNRPRRQRRHRPQRQAQGRLQAAWKPCGLSVVGGVEHPRGEQNSSLSGGCTKGHPPAWGTPPAHTCLSWGCGLLALCKDKGWCAQNPMWPCRGGDTMGQEAGCSTNTVHAHWQNYLRRRGLGGPGAGKNALPVTLPTLQTMHAAPGPRPSPPQHLSSAGRSTWHLPVSPMPAPPPSWAPCLQHGPSQTLLCAASHF